MAQGGDKIPMNVGVKVESRIIKLSYKVGKNVDKNKITWDWREVDGQYRAEMEAVTSSGVKYHRSAPVSADTLGKLGETKKSLEGEYYQVKIKTSSHMPELQSIFDTTT